MRQFMLMLLAIVLFGSCNQKSDFEIGEEDVLSSQIALDQVEIIDIKAEYQRLKNDLLSKYKGKEYPKAYTRQLVASILKQYPKVKDLKDEARIGELAQLVGITRVKSTGQESKIGGLKFRSGTNPWPFIYEPQNCPYYYTAPEDCSNWFLGECVYYCEENRQYAAGEIILWEMAEEAHFIEASQNCGIWYSTDALQMQICFDEAAHDHMIEWQAINNAWANLAHAETLCQCNCSSLFGGFPCE